MTMNSYPHTIILIGGPTASGKSLLALEWAKAHNGVVINADSMQLYREIPILSGQPSTQEMAEVPHELYSVLSVREQASAAWWRAQAVAKIRETLAAGKLPIVLGGTGLYLKSLYDGLSDIPDIRAEVRKKIADLYDGSGVTGLYTALQSDDAAMAARLKPNDRQRISRALEVVWQTGKSLSEFQGARQAGEDWNYKTVLILPPREVIYKRCQARFDGMIEAGAMDEIKQLEAMGDLPPSTALKAKGIPELRAYLRGELSWDNAIRIAKTKTRQYAKRQYTWFRNQIGDKADRVIDRVVDGESVGEFRMGIV